ncbi:SCF ubiquitin ligase complex subunit cdc4, variant 2 [Basidiobolus ranarum]|uniref:SCF ubiquitin ligase complex subunit cdc4, variant 2 n=1 Tax=Basidiobolus ranarum TaxID=34480 RepID=A0ABR2WQP8_9FUNG
MYLKASGNSTITTVEESEVNSSKTGRKRSLTAIDNVRTEGCLGTPIRENSSRKKLKPSIHIETPPHTVSSKFQKEVYTPSCDSTYEPEEYEIPSSLASILNDPRHDTIWNEPTSPALPSPCLSPTTLSDRNLPFLPEDSQDESFSDTKKEISTDVSLVNYDSNFKSESISSSSLTNMLSSFDALPYSLQSYMLFQMLRRCPTNTLQYVSSVILPTLKCDFFGLLPYCLSLKIASFLDCRSMCKAAQVSKKWRKVIDSDPITWKRLIEREGYIIDEVDEHSLMKCVGNQHTISNLQVPKTAPRESSPCDSDQGYKYACKTSSSYEQGYFNIKSESHTPLANSNKIMEEPPLEYHDTKSELTAEVRKLSKYHALEKEVTHFEKEYLSASADSFHSGVKKTSTENEDHQGPPMNLPSVANHGYKQVFRRHYLIQRNWMEGKSKSISFPGHGHSVVTCLQFDSDKIISGSEDQCINVYDIKTGQLRKRLEGHDGGVWALQYVGNTLVSGSTDRTVRVWDIEKGICTHIFYGHTSTVRCLQIIMPSNVNPNPNGPPVMEPPFPIVVTGSRDSTLRIWRLPSPVHDPPYLPSHPNSPMSQANPNPFLINTLTGHTHSVRAIAGLGNLVVSGSYDTTVRVWNYMTGENIWRMVGHTQKVYSVVIDKKRKRCMSGSMDCTVRVWSLENGSCLHILEGHSSLVGLLNLTPEYLVSAAADSTLRIWSPDDGTCSNVLSAHTGAITCFQHNSEKVISGSDGTLKMWDIRTGKFIRDLLTGLSGVWQVQFDHRRCVAAVQINSATWFEVLDFGVDGIENSTPIHEIGGSVDEQMSVFSDSELDPTSIETEPSSAQPAMQYSYPLLPSQTHFPSSNHHLNISSSLHFSL